MEARQKRFGWLSATSALAFGGCSLAAPAFAQVTQVAQASPASTVGEVVVTAEKRSTNIQTTALAVSVLSGQSLQDKQITDLESLASSVPSLTSNSTGPTAATSIRGVGLAVSTPAVLPGVPLYRDGLLSPTLVPNEPFFDIADVEVLRGPQGTLVGGNSTGGAVFINSQNPTLNSNNGYIEGVVGSYALAGLQGADNVVLAPNLAVRLSGYYNRQDSYWTDLAPHRGLIPGASDQGAVRLGVLYQPNGQFSLLWKTNVELEDDGGFAHRPQINTPPSVGYPTGHYQLSYPDPHTYFDDLEIRSGVEAKYVFGDGIVLKSTSGMFYLRNSYGDEQYSNLNLTSAASTPLNNHVIEHIYSQEFNLVSPAGDRFHWVAGTYTRLWRSQIRFDAPITVPVLVDQGVDHFTGALYGEGGYDVTRKLEIHFGLRETFNNNYGIGGVYLTLPGAPFFLLSSNDVREVDNLTTGRVGIDYKATRDQFIYAVAAKGAKTGGINGSGNPNFGPETVYDYEVGLKSTWLGGHLRTQLDGFYMDYDNLQLTIAEPVAGAAPMGGVGNTGKSTIKGFEASAQMHVGGLSVDGNLSYVNSSVNAGRLLNTYLYNQKGLNPIGLQCATGQTTGCFDYSPYYQEANNVADPYSPTWSANLGVQYAFRITDRGTLTPRADFSYTSSQWATVFENDVDHFQPRYLLNLDLTYAQDDWRVSLFGTNVANDYFITGQTGPNNFYSAPAEFGARFHKSF